MSERTPVSAEPSKFAAWRPAVRTGVIMGDAELLRTDDEARSVAARLAAEFAVEAGSRDRDRRLPAAELDQLSASGLLGISVPARFGGVEVSAATLAEVFRVLAQADPSLAQIPHSHFVFLDALRRQGSLDQQAFYFAEALAGRRFANAQSERSGASVTDDATRLIPTAEGYRLTGEKFYCTGALFAHWLVVRAVIADETGRFESPVRKALAYIHRNAPGVEIDDDWDGMGQRTTASGTVRLTDVPVLAREVVSYSSLFDRPSTYGARAQLLHAAIDTGIARGAAAAAVQQVHQARAWFESGAASAAEDPLLVQQAGELELVVRSAEALLRAAAESVDAAEARPTEQSTAEASIATAVAKVAGARAAVHAADELFELGGTRSAAGALNLSRFWRDGRTHTLHDPSRWKVQHLGRWLLSGTTPPRHGLL